MNILIEALIWTFAVGLGVWIAYFILSYIIFFIVVIGIAIFYLLDLLGALIEEM